MHLGSAPKRIRVLHLVAPPMRLADRRAVQQPHDVAGRRRLTTKRPQRVHLGDERVARALQCLERQRTHAIGDAGEPPRAHERERALGSHELRPVDQREALLRQEANRFEAGTGERLAAVEQLSLPPRIAPLPRAATQGARAARGLPRRRRNPEQARRAARRGSNSRAVARPSPPARPSCLSRARSRAAALPRARPSRDTGRRRRTRAISEGATAVPLSAPPGSRWRRTCRSPCSRRRCAHARRVRPPRRRLAPLASAHGQGRTASLPAGARPRPPTRRREKGRRPSARASPSHDPSLVPAPPWKSSFGGSAIVVPPVGIVPLLTASAARARATRRTRRS